MTTELRYTWTQDSTAATIFTHGYHDVLAFASTVGNDPLGAVPSILSHPECGNFCIGVEYENAPTYFVQFILI